MYSPRKFAVSAAGVLFEAFLFAHCGALLANDSAAEVAVGGIQLRKEARISMEKERLTISLQKVTVEYEFLNTADQDITTEVAFPVPPYRWFPEKEPGAGEFNDFRLWVDGKEVEYKVELHAKLKEEDYTSLLQALGIDIQKFGEANLDGTPQVERLSKVDRDKLLQVGLIDDYGFPEWVLHKSYYWTQVFPSKKVIRVRHEYKPQFGLEWVEIDRIQKESKDACVSPELNQTLSFLAARRREERKHDPYPSEPSISVWWVKYILTTANTWKTPIRNFQLVVEPQQPDLNTQPLGLAMCWDGDVERSSTNRLVAKKVDFVPASELAVYYFSDYIEFTGKPSPR